MKTEVALSELVADKDNQIARWVCRGLNCDTNWLKDFRTFGVIRNNQIIAGIIFHNARFGQDVWWTIYSTDKHWCTKRIVKILMKEAFENLQCRRINVLIDSDNQKCLKLVKQLNFKIEGRLRQFNDDGKDRYILGLLKSENKYI